MKKVRGQLLRWMLIIRKIQNHPYISFEELMREVEHDLAFHGYETSCSAATLKRDLYELREEFGIEIVYDHRNKGYKLQTMKKDWLDIDSIIEPFELLTSLGTESGVPSFIIPEKYQAKGMQHLSYIIHAIRHSLKITFLYYKYSDKTSSERLLSPYALKEWRGRWYVIGKDKDEIVKTFGLDRMDRLIITTEYQRDNSSFDIANKFHDSFGIYASEEYPIEEIILAFAPEDGSYLKSRPLHPSQEIIEENDTEIIIRLHLRSTPDFLMEIISRSWSLRIIQPASLRQKVCKIYEDALKRNSRENGE